MRYSRCLVPAGLLSVAIAIPLPATGCCRIEIPGGGEIAGLVELVETVAWSAPCAEGCGCSIRCNAGGAQHRLGRFHDDALLVGQVS